VKPKERSVGSFRGPFIDSVLQRAHAVAYCKTPLRLCGGDGSQFSSPAAGAHLNIEYPGAERSIAPSHSITV
jgi:hypothetical protein